MSIRIPGRSPLCSREGMVLPIVLVCGVLLVSMVISFQFVSASDYKRVARLNRAAQATALADLAADEVHAALADMVYGSTASTPAPWVKTLMEDLRDSVLSGGIAGFQDEITFAGNQIPATTAAAADAETFVEIDEIKATVNNFRRVGNLFPANTIYKEALFDDTGPELEAWDIAGDIHLQVQVRSDGGPFTFGQTYQRGQSLYLTDTTPLASQFTLFSYMPPPTEEYAVRDLQRGPDFNVNPTMADPGDRIMIRGPLLLVPDEAPPDPDPQLAGPDPLGESLGYMDTKYAGAPGSFATIPGPRTIHHPDTGGGGAIAGLGSVLDNLESERGVRRSEEVKSAGVLKVKKKLIKLTLKTFQSGFFCPGEAKEDKEIEFDLPDYTYNLGEVSVSVVQDWTGNNPLVNSIDPEPVSYYPSMAYFVSPGPPGGQSFKINQYMPSINHASVSYKGIEQRFALGGASALWGGAALNEGERVILEPVLDGSKTTQENSGIFGLYGVVNHHQKTYAAMPMREFLQWLFRFLVVNWDDYDKEIPAIVAFLCDGPKKYGEIAIRNLETPSVDVVGQFMTQLGLDPNLTIVVHRFEEEPHGVSPNPGSLSNISTALSNRKAAVLPYGSYYHEDSFWDSAPGSSKKQALHDDLRQEKSGFGGGPTGHTRTLDALITSNSTPNYSGVDSGWPAGSFAEQMAQWLTGEYSQKLLQGTAGAAAADPGGAASAIFGQARIVGVPSLPPGGNRRPQGAFGDYGSTQATTVDLGPVTSEYPGGYYPSRYRDFNAIVTRTYETFDDYMTVESRGGILPLRGAVFIRTMNAPSFQYQGRGIIICTSTGAGAPATIGGNVAPAPGGSAGTDMLVLVHRVPPANLADAPTLGITGNFQGNIYSDTGVNMAGGSIQGNLVTGLLNKEKSGGVTLDYHADIDKAAAGTLDTRWTIEMGGEVTSTGSN